GHVGIVRGGFERRRTKREPDRHDDVVVALGELGDVVSVVRRVDRLDVVDFRAAQRSGQHAFPRALVEALVGDAPDIGNQPDAQVAQIVLLAVDQLRRFDLFGGFLFDLFGRLLSCFVGHHHFGFLGCNFFSFFLSRFLFGSFFGGLLSRLFGFLSSRSHRNRSAFFGFFLSRRFFGYFLSGLLSRFFFSRFFGSLFGHFLSGFLGRFLSLFRRSARAVAGG